MKNIDFLPIRYRERTVQRRARIWRGVMLCCLAGFVGIVALAQLTLRRPIERQLEQVNARYPAAVAASTHADQMQKDLSEVEQFAAMYTYLRHPWPVTQLLACLSDGLPDSVVILEISLDRKASANSAVPPTNEQKSNQPPSAAEAAKRDFERLRTLQDGTVAAIHVTGVTSDVTKLHGYVSGLAPSPLFKAAKVESLEAVSSDAGISGSRFELRLLVRPGYGQPGGPEKPAATAADSLASSSANERTQP